jgi:hypothetical protein
MLRQSIQPRWIRIILLYLILSNAVPGGWALFMPDSFYTSFPGFGRTWVSVDGPYNEHLIRDVGAFFLAVTTLCCLTLIVPRLVTAQATASCLLVFNIPHLLYHLRHLHMLPWIDQVGNIVALSLAVLLPILLLIYSASVQKSRQSVLF